MSRLIITADVHGSYSTWLTLESLMTPQDGLVIAGDLFDTKYGHHSNPDFQPEQIRERLRTFPYPVHYVYGNCDDPAFYPGQSHSLDFQFQGLKIHMHHGHQGTATIPADTDLVIQGHTHLCLMERQHNTLFFNPGSLSCPRNGLYSYGKVEQEQIQLMDLKTGTALSTLSLNKTCKHE